MNKSPILFIMKERESTSKWGSSDERKPGLYGAIAAIASTLTRFGIAASVELVADQNGIDQLVQEHQPQTAIIEAYWVTPGKLQLLRLLHPQIHWIVHNHSEVPFLADEGIGGQWTCEYIKLGAEVATVSTRTIADLYPMIDNLGGNPNQLTHLPNIYPLNQIRPAVKPIPGDTIHVGCFGAIRPLKNQFQQAMAAIGYAHSTGRKLFFHINGTRVEIGGSQPLKNLRGTFLRLHNCELVEHTWMDQDMFFTLLKDTIDVAMQCSLTESFNIISADAVSQSVPVIASPEIRWMGGYAHADPNCTRSIRHQMEAVLNHGHDTMSHYVDKQMRDLKEYNEQALSIWIKRFG